MPLFWMGCFPVDFQEVKRPLRTKSVKRPIKVGKRPINEGKRPIKAKVLVGVSVGCLMGCFRAPQPCRKMAPLKRPIKRSMIFPTRIRCGKSADVGVGVESGSWSTRPERHKPRLAKIAIWPRRPGAGLGKKKTMTMIKIPSQKTC